MDDRTTLSDDEILTGGYEERLAQVSDADQDDPDMDTGDTDTDDTDADADDSDS